MLDRLYIQNYAIIDQLDVRFSKGLSIITGETGAGKSILLGALGLILGKRADSKVLWDPSRKCVIEAQFKDYPQVVDRFLTDNELDAEEHLIIRREINLQGKSRAFVNDTPVKLGLLSQLTNQLVDMHQQFDQLDIQTRSFQLSVLDALAGNKALLSNYQDEYQVYKSLDRKLKNLEGLQSQALKESDFIKFQWQELDAAGLSKKEKTELEEEAKRLTYAEDIRKVLDQIYLEMEESEYSLLDKLSEMQRSLEKISVFDSEIPNLAERMLSSIEELKDLSQSILHKGVSTEFDPQKLEEKNQRLDLIYRLENKHKVEGIDALLEIKDNFESELQKFEDLSFDIDDTKSKLAKSQQKLESLSLSLHKKRESICSSFEENVRELLEQLAMPQAAFKVNFTETPDFGENGKDQVTFQFSANKGHQLQALEKVASGGEVSRLNLCIKSLIVGALSLPTLIFDEIDAGVSGEVANKMGTILSNLSKNHQLITITHSPQIASRADKHYFIFKQEFEDRTLASVKYLEDDERIIEIAKMLSGDPPSNSALANARDLIASSN
jgi:DNA repair protein RecN (Recombination protein N)